MIIATLQALYNLVRLQFNNLSHTKTLKLWFGMAAALDSLGKLTVGE